MKKENDGLPLLKNILFVIAIHILSVTNMLIWRNGIVNDKICLVIQLILCIISIPTYFFFKSDQSWKYTLLTILSHIVVVALSCFLLPFFFDGWNVAIVYWTEIALCVTFGILIISDIIVNIRS